MRGQILVFNEQKQTGVIAAENSQRLMFPISNWQDVVPPEAGMAVEFTLNQNGQPQQIQLALPQPTNTYSAQPKLKAQHPKRKPVLTLWALFLGCLGAHRFYMGAWGWGLAQALGVLILSAIFGAIHPSLGALPYLAVLVLTWVEVVRYIWMSDAAFETKLQAYQAKRPGAFGFFW